MSLASDSLAPKRALLASARWRHLVFDRARLLLVDLGFEQIADHAAGSMLSLYRVAHHLIIGMPASFSVPIISRISWRSIKAPQAVVAGTVGDRLMDEPERLGRSDGQRRHRRALTGQDVEHDVATDSAASDRLGAGSFNRI